MPRPQSSHTTPAACGFAYVLAAIIICSATLAAAGTSLSEAIAQTQPKIVKIYSAGGFRGMEAHQSGMLISAEGHIITAFSYVLDTDYITVTLDDGRKFEQARLVVADPALEVAVLKIDAADLPHFDLADAVEIDAGTRVLALSNLFNVAIGNEPASVQHGVVSVKTQLEARRGVFETPYRGPVYVLDAMTNNPGAAGGALVTRNGRLAGMLGKELRNSLNNTWLNYAVPIAQLRTSVDEIRAGKFVTPDLDKLRKKPDRSLELASLGIALVPDVLERTPPYVDYVESGSPAAIAGIRPDDLVLLLGERLIQSCKLLRSELEYVDFEDPIRLVLLRGLELVDTTLQVEFADEEGTP